MQRESEPTNQVDRDVADEEHAVAAHARWHNPQSDRTTPGLPVPGASVDINPSNGKGEHVQHFDALSSSPYTLLSKSKCGYLYDPVVAQNQQTLEGNPVSPEARAEDGSVQAEEAGVQEEKAVNTRTDESNSAKDVNHSGSNTVVSVRVTAGAKSSAPSSQAWPKSEGYVSNCGNSKDMQVFKQVVEDVDWVPPRDVTDQDSLHMAESEEVSSSGRDFHRRVRTDVHAYTRQYYLKLAKQILASLNVDELEKWLQILPVLAESAAAAIDKVAGLDFGVMEPKFFIKIKRIQGSLPEKSCIVQGVTCRKNVVHKKMPKLIRSPKVMLLRGSVEYQRIENQLSSFDTLMDQEKQHLQLAIARIMQHRPDVILVEQTMSRYAQDLLLQNNVALVLNVKLTLLERIARCTGGTIASAQELFKVSEGMMGSCAEFRMENISTGCNGAKTLMHFDGCPEPLGCTVLLHGKSQASLEAPKKALKLLSLAAWNACLEESFVSDLLVAAASSIWLREMAIGGVDIALKRVSQIVTALPKFIEAWNTMNFQGVVHSVSPNVLHVDNPDTESSSILEERDQEVKGNTLGIFNEQHIYVSIAATSPRKGQLCEPAQVHRLDYYSSTDVPLNFFLAAILPHEENICPNHECKESNTNHLRYYRHGNGQIIVSCHVLEGDDTLPATAYDRPFWIWVEKAGSRRSLLHPLTGCLSLGQFFALVFSVGRVTTSLSQFAAQHEDLEAEVLWGVRACLKSVPFGPETSAFFIGQGKSVVRFCYEAITAYQVSLPRKDLQLDDASDTGWRVLEVEQLYQAAERSYDEIFLSLEALISNFQLKDNLGNQLESMKKEAQIQRNLFLEKVRLSSTGEGNKVVSDYKREVQPIHILEVNQLRRSLEVSITYWATKVQELQAQLASANNATGKQQLLIGHRGTMSQNEHRQTDGAEDLPHHKRSQSVPVISDSQLYESNHDSDYGSHSPEVVQSGSEKSAGTMAGVPSKPASQDTENKLSSIPFLPHLKGRLFLPDGQNKEVVVVYDNEPTTIIAHMLVSEAYKVKLAKASQFARCEGGRALAGAESGKQSKSPDSSQGEKTGTKPSRVRRGSVAGDPAGAAVTTQPFSITETQNKSRTNSQHSSPGMSEGSESVKEQLLYNETDVLLSKEPAHIEYTFEDVSANGQKSQFKVVAVYGPQFSELRKVALAEDGESGFVKSLCRCMKWDSSGGKSNAYFAKTLDNRLVVKQMSRSEMHSFLQFGPSYFEYMSQALSTDVPSALCKILGVYQLTIKHVGANVEKDTRIDLMVMENVFYGRRVQKIYDLKGSLRSRYADERGRPNAVLLDENLLQQLVTEPLLVSPMGHGDLSAALKRDTEMLCKLNVMDYSLIVGVDEESKELVVGIIDYVRQYTWDKQLESWVKSYGILGGGKRVPTIITPKEYMKRFQNAMALYFSVVPSSDPRQVLQDGEHLL
uniref:1-phosphatidylinositol-3-phosphate 5-kinase n=2 Tax=Picocystis salinarum TaxID=88271 RepID=A0A7S3UE36_9CHLO